MYRVQLWCYIPATFTGALIILSNISTINCRHWQTNIQQSDILIMSCSALMDLYQLTSINLSCQYHVPWQPASHLLSSPSFIYQSSHNDWWHLSFCPYHVPWQLVSHLLSKVVNLLINYPWLQLILTLVSLVYKVAYFTLYSPVW